MWQFIQDNKTLSLSFSLRILNPVCSIVHIFMCSPGSHSVPGRLWCCEVAGITTYSWPAVFSMWRTGIVSLRLPGLEHLKEKQQKVLWQTKTRQNDEGTCSSWRSDIGNPLLSRVCSAAGKGLKAPLHGAAALKEAWGTQGTLTGFLRVADAFLLPSTGRSRT